MTTPQQPPMPPEHFYQRAELDLCDYVVFRLESGQPVICGLKRSQHPIDPPPIPDWQTWADR